MSKMRSDVGDPVGDSSAREKQTKERNRNSIWG
jgi:hypothetical protein